MISAIALLNLGSAPTGKIEITDINSVAELVAINTGDNGYGAPSLSDGSIANVDGYFSANDGGGGIFVFSAYSAATADAQNIIAPTQGLGRWIRQANTQSTQSNPVIAAAKTMSDGGALQIAEYGDSTTVGYISGLVIGATPAPSVLQSTLRAFYQNNTITVNNRGVSATKTTDVIAAWVATMAAEVSSVVILNYGMNDNITLTHAQFAANLKTLIAGIRGAGKLAILKTPNPARQQGALASVAKCEAVKEFAEVVRVVGRETNTPVIDVYASVLSRWSAGVDIVTDITDGIHPSDELYSVIGRECAWLFLGRDFGVLTGKEIVPVSSALFRPYTIGSTGAIYSTVGVYVTANKILCAFKVAAPGIDVYLGSAITSATSDNVSATLNDTALTAINQKSAALVNAWPCDNDILILENAKPGVYILTLSAPVAELAIATYFRAWPTRIPGRVVTSKAAGNSLAVDFRNYALPYAKVTSDSADIKHLITGIPLSCYGRTVTIQFKGTLQKLGGIVLFACNRSAANAHIKGGVLICPNLDTGFLAVFEASEFAYNAADVIGAVDISGAEHAYLITITAGGLMTLSIDGVQIGTHQLVIPYVGGKIGIFTAVASSVTITNLEIY